MRYRCSRFLFLEGGTAAQNPSHSEDGSRHHQDAGCGQAGAPGQRLMHSRRRASVQMPTAEAARPASQKQQLQVKSRHWRQTVPRVAVDFSPFRPSWGRQAGKGLAGGAGSSVRQEDRRSRLRKLHWKARDRSQPRIRVREGGGLRGPRLRAQRIHSRRGAGPRPRTRDAGQSRAPRMGGTPTRAGHPLGRDTHSGRTPTRAGPRGPPKAAEARWAVAPGCPQPHCGPRPLHSLFK